MSERLNRRGFLRNTSVAAAGAAGLAGAGWGVERAEAIEPVRRTSAPRFQFSLAAYSYRSLLQGANGAKPELTLTDFINDCAKMNLEGTELTSYYFPEQPDGEYLRDLKRQCFVEGLTISGTAVRNDFCHPPGPERDRDIAHVKRWAEYAETLGAPVIRIFSGNAKKGQTVAEAHRLAVEGIEECCEHAGRHGVFLALENHGGLTTELDGILALVRDVQSPWFGVNLDTGNFRTSDPYADMARLAPYAVNVQVKVTVHPSGGETVRSDYKRLASILTEAGYRGFVVLEFEEKEDPRVACPREVDRLRAAFA